MFFIVIIIDFTQAGFWGFALTCENGSPEVGRWTELVNMAP